MGLEKAHLQGGPSVSWEAERDPEGSIYSSRNYIGRAEVRFNPSLPFLGQINIATAIFLSNELEKYSNTYVLANRVNLVLHNLLATRGEELMVFRLCV
jgi:hypothetical protein